MNQDEFNKVEAPAIAQLISMGWVYVHGKKLSPDYIVEIGRASCRERV